MTVLILIRNWCEYKYKLKEVRKELKNRKIETALSFTIHLIACIGFAWSDFEVGAYRDGFCEKLL